MTHAAAHKDEKKETDTTKTDEVQNGGKETLTQRVEKLEEKLANVIRRNHLLEVDR